MRNRNGVVFIRNYPRVSAAENPRPNPQAIDSKQNSQDRPRPYHPALTPEDLHW
jgi:hypothetical protein